MRFALAAVVLVAAVPAHAVSRLPAGLGAPQTSQALGPGQFATGSDMRGNLDEAVPPAPSLFQLKTPLTPRFEPNSVGGGPRPPGVIPEPGTWAMFILGFGALGAMMRRRRTVATGTRSAGA
jgi:hypothetical protein